MTTTSDRHAPRVEGKYLEKIVKTGVTIYAGTQVAIEQSSGEFVPASDTAGINVIGIADAEVTGDGEKRLLVEISVFLMENDDSNPVTTAHIGQNCYVKDNDTVSSDGGTNSVVSGRVHDVIPEGVFVDYLRKA